MSLLSSFLFPHDAKLSGSSSDFCNFTSDLSITKQLPCLENSVFSLEI